MKRARETSPAGHPPRSRTGFFSTLLAPRSDLLPWRAAAFAVCALVLGGNAWHLLRQQAPPSWDDAWYLEVSFRIFYALKESLAAAASTYAEAFRIKAPLIAVLPLPLYFLIGAGERVGLWMNQVLLVATWYLIYRIASSLYEERAGLAAVCAAALLPLLYGLSRVYLVETLLTCLVCAAQWAIIKSRNDSRQGATGRGLLLGLGLLAKSIFPLYLAGTLWLRRKEFSRLRLTLTVAAAVASTWYVFNVFTVLGFGLSAGFGSIGRHYGAFSALALADYGGKVGRDVLSWPYLAAAVLLLWGAGKARWGPAERFLAAWLAVPMTVLLLGVNKEMRFLAPALPAIAIFLGAQASAAAGKRPWLVAALLLGPLTVFSAQTFGLPPAAALVYNGPPDPDPGWNRAGLVAAVARHAGPDSVVAVALEHRRLNANNLASLAAASGYRFGFVSLGYAQASAEGAFIRLRDKGADHLILVDAAADDSAPDFLNRANAGVRAAVKKGSLKSAFLEEVALAPGIRASLYSLPR